MLTVTYIFHDCFLIETPESAFLFDFWKAPLDSDSEIPDFLNHIPAEKPLYIFVSHHHKDHFNRSIFQWARFRENIDFIISTDTWKLCRSYLSPSSLYKGFKPMLHCVHVIKEGENIELPQLSVYALGSTDIGCSYFVRTACGKKIFHAGDLNAWIWRDESSNEEVADAIKTYEDCLKPLSALTHDIDLAFFPVDSRIGSEYWTGAKIFVRKFAVSHFFPMHFELGENDIERRKLALDACKFSLYANSSHGEYIALQSPYSSFATP